MDTNNIDQLLQRVAQGNATEEQMAQAEARLEQMEKRLERQIDGWNTVERSTNRQARTTTLRWIAGVAASLLLLVSIVLIANNDSSLFTQHASTPATDTFDNPEDAAAETQRALLKFSEAINKAIK